MVCGAQPGDRQRIQCGSAQAHDCSATSRRPGAWQAFQEDVRAAENESHFIRNSGHYPLCGRGDVNTYAVFAELVRQIVAGWPGRDHRADRHCH